MKESGLPKAELHCHLIGVINPDLLKEIQKGSGSILVDPEVLDAAYPIYDGQSFKRWMNVVKPYQSNAAESLRPVLAAHISSLIEHQVVYSEIMISVTMFPSEISSLLRAFHSWREWVYELEQGKVQIEFVMVVPRTLHADALVRDTETFISLYREELIVGVALVGPEDGKSIERFAPSFTRWRGVGLGIEIHAGEHSGPEAVWDALKHGKPDRLGHAISAFNDLALLDEIRRADIHIEFCLTSNICTGAVRSIQNHPVDLARKLGMNFSLSTDNPGAFECSMTSEFHLASQAFSFDRHDFEAILGNSLASRFQPRLRYLKQPADLKGSSNPIVQPGFKPD
jgi:adenosine deaminase